MHSHHMKDDHSRVVEKAFMMAELQEYEPLIAAGPFPPGHVEGQKDKPIEGLLLYDGFTCKLCHKSWKTMKSVINHFMIHHKCDFEFYSPAARQRRVHIQADKCQGLYGHVHRRWFPVLPYIRQHTEFDLPRDNQTPTPELGRSEAVTLLLEKLESCAAEEAEQSPDSLFDEDMANWVYVTGIYTYTQGLLASGKSCEELVVAGAGNENVESMVAYIATWINNTMKRLHKTGQLLKRMCMAETSELEDNKALMPLQEKASVFKYARILATFMWFLIEQAEDPLDADMEIHDVTKAQILALRDVVLHLTAPDTDPSQLDFMPATEDHVSSHVSGILCSVFQTYCGGWAQQYQLPPMAFIALSVFKEDGTYDSPNLITHLIAAMQYGTRLAFAEQYLDEPRPRFNPAADPTVPLEDNTQKFEFLRKGGPGPFKYVRQLMHLVSTVILSEALPDTTFWTDHEHETVEVDNKVVTVTGIRDCIHSQQKRAQEDLSQLLKGCKMPLFDTSLYKDVANFRQPGTNFLNHSGLEHSKYGLHLLKEWTRKKDVHGLLAERWESKLDEGVTVYDKSIWKASAVWDWLEMYDNLQERLYFLYHVASGQPMHGREEASSLLVNTRLDQRNLYLRGDSFVFLTWYHKSRNITGKNKPRMTFLPKSHTFIWFYFLAFLRPTAIFFLKALGQPERARDMATKVWGGVAGLGIQSWRHVSVAIVDAHIKLHCNTLLADEDDMIDCQRGHSTFTANSAYGGTGGYHVDRKSEGQYLQASAAMHRFWEIDGIRQTGFAPPATDKPIPSGELINTALQRYTGEKQPRTRGPFQSNWLAMVFDRHYDMLVVAKTGGGKSLAYMLPPLVEYKGVTVIVQPLKALVNETADELRRMRVSHVKYKSGDKIANWTRAVVCTTDKAATEEFFEAIRGLQINRVIIDEAHCYEDDVNYQGYAPAVGRLRILNCPFVFMTATMQVGHEDTLFNVFSVRQVQVEREPTGRQELRWEIMPGDMDWKSMIKHMGTVATWRELEERDRNIIFIENIAECESTKEDLQKLHPDLITTLYHSRLSPETAKANVMMWKTTPKCLMIATSGFGAGINYKHVRNVMILGLPEDGTDVNKCFQEAGRAGRDTAPANVWLYPIGKPEKNSFAERLIEGQNCLIGTFAELLDGMHRTCADVGRPAKCNHCVANENANHKRQVEVETEEVMPGTRPMYESNVKRAKMADLILKQIGHTILKLRKEMAGKCGHCFAKDSSRVTHEKCDGIGKSCVRCLGGHWVRDCPVSKMSDTLGHYGSKARFLCHFCGLPTKWLEEERFHDTSTDGKRKSCDSGLQNFCEPYCWYFFRHRKSTLGRLIKKLELPSGHVPVEKATECEFQEWLGMPGWLGCLWANMCSLFAVLRDVHIRNQVL
ncbi:uncharacterized protein MELLADRAFT_93356 [Melampsora larici-populina 98AG31]|uniref:DNA 3'-5' helicase n=1 Tax=Melampsora larici-populina (strain 98AG31 / pathotype 3-4-7) TaxID=747676 RepID=F4S4W2_MELLP|nr:uncharacterized protein MELLADRAFT_93356 [Melampsora larici-populina 98AG31]EGG00361.1 hypothetical protein MELLADRAFT_93356 [Melampsora larici-populina 98AG31]